MMKTISEAKKHLSFHLKGRNLQNVPALVGLTGIGKTAIVKQVANELGAELIYFNMAQLAEGELAMPLPVNENKNDQGSVLYAFNHKVKKALNNPDKKYIVFVDEFTRGTVPVISEWMTIINERQLQGEHFGDNVRFVTAMNPTTSMYGFADTDYLSTDIDDAHSNRLTFLHLKASLPDWLKWAENEGNIHPAITSFLKVAHNSKYFYGKETDGIRMRTPRSWEFLSMSFEEMEEQGLMGDNEFLLHIIGDHVGEDIAHEMSQFMIDCFKVVDYDEVMGETELSPVSLEEFKSLEDSAKHAIMTGLIHRIAAEAPDMGPVQVGNFLKLWLAIDSVDIKWAISYDYVNVLFDAKNDPSLLGYYDDLLHETDIPESKIYSEFVEKYQQETALAKEVSKYVNGNKEDSETN